ncbi:hypothetical protein CH373_00065 [Leptospira perolatii]|uniref:DUF4281 domain-containing protein n=1 Tax=Leptospira perolatii TaxID=2023191 RepID=A0A2M9ZR05_9LEPT|nr:ABA4-like family protein [Leptospira perolatii]PJZ70974.1 hypothetical protein CH360_00065 [Leptospira perolatii]PJZ74506.1 hypothetical protein CH373_00065 [Leptospira perolatii]
MTPEIVFSIANPFAAIGWLLLAILPNTKITKLLVRSGLWSGALSVIYLFIILFNFGRSEGGFSSLPGVALLFQNQWVLLAGWIHYLAFDLFLGIWETKEAEALGIPRWVLIPCLFLTFMLGPIGFLLFYIVRLTKGKRYDDGI